ncbi:MAG: sulfatase, partial [Planctomycetota bacterium]
FVILYADDLGYADLGCYGATTIRTPRLDALAAEGTRFTSFYAQPVCGPSRGALMTGRYPNRIGGGWTVVTEEITLAELLKQHGYSTCCIGKWDMSQRRYVPGQVPNDQGFDYYYGPLGANDSGRVRLHRNREAAGSTDDMGSLTGSYTDEAIAYLRKHHNEPFLLYLAYTMPHVRIGASEQFRGKSAGGLYGDVVEEIDWNVGRVVDCLKELGIEKETLVIFASDNGPWLSKGAMAGSARPLRDGKGSAWEGGFRVPCIAWCPGSVPAGAVLNELICTLDILPTVATLAGTKPAANVRLDGRDQSELLTGKSTVSARDDFYYYVRGNLHAVRQGKWKLALPERMLFYDFARDNPPVTTPELYDLEADVSEARNVAAEHPDVVERLLKLAARARADVGDQQEIDTEESKAAGRKKPL